MGILLSAIAVVAFGSTFFYREKMEENAEEFTVVTSFYPMYIAAENLTQGRDGMRLVSLSEPQTGCLHDYQMTPEDMKLLATADVFVVNGGGIEEFLTDVAEQYPDLAIVDASQGLELLEASGAHDHDDHDHGLDINGHAWMSIALHRQQLENICEGLAAADPGYEKLYRENLAAYDEKLASLQAEQQELAREFSGKTVILFHEAYAYVAADYGMHVELVMDLDEERQVSAGEVAQVMAAVENEQVSLILAEEQYGKEMGDMVQKETGAAVCYLDTLVRGDYDKDSYLERMEQNLLLLRKAAEKL